MLKNIGMLPKEYKKDLKKAIEILKEAGCKEIYLFGSLVEGNIEENSDIDLAIKGCPSGKYFHLIGTLIMELDHSIDLINLDKDLEIASFLEKDGEMLNVS